MTRVRSLAAPLNAIRHGLHRPRPIPTVETGVCADCRSEWRICDTWLTTERGIPRGRISVVLVNDDSGL